MENIAAKLQTPIADKRCSPKPCSLTLNREPKTQNPETRSQDVRELRRVALLSLLGPPSLGGFGRAPWVAVGAFCGFSGFYWV